MKVTYDNYYQTENLFGAPYPELLAFFSKFDGKEKVLDLGCGQGRDAVSIARLGFEVVGMDNSMVGIEQMNQIAQAEKLNLKGVVADIFELDNYAAYDFVLLDSMFHFLKKDRKKETEFIQKIISNLKKGALLIFCNQDTGNKIDILNQTIDFDGPLERVEDQKFLYRFEDTETGHTSETNYRLVVVRK